MRHLKVLPISVFIFLVIFGAARFEPAVTYLEDNGLSYTAYGGAQMQNNSLGVTATGLTSRGSGLTVDVNGQQAGSIQFDPVLIDIGSTFSLMAIDENEELIARYDLVQVSSNETEVWLTVGEEYFARENVTLEVFATHESGRSESRKLNIKSNIFLGVVTSQSSAWLETWHWIEIEGEWILALDPEGTWIDFANDGENTLIPFKYLGVALPAVEGPDIKLSRVELGSAVHPAL